MYPFLNSLCGKGRRSVKRVLEEQVGEGRRGQERQRTLSPRVSCARLTLILPLLAGSTQASS